jgi:hypothetical protein
MPETTNGNKQRSNIPRTTTVKRLHKQSKSNLSMKVWARQQNDQIVKDWLEHKNLGA